MKSTRKSILSLLLAVLFLVSLTVPAFATELEHKEVHSLSELLQRDYEELVSQPSAYLTDDVMNGLAAYLAGDEDLAGEYFLPVTAYVRKPGPNIDPPPPGPKINNGRHGYLNMHATNLSVIDIDDTADLSLSSVLAIYVEKDNALYYFTLILNNTDHDILVDGLDYIKLTMPDGTVLAEGYPEKFTHPINVRANQNPWWFYLQFKEGTYKPNVKLDQHIYIESLPHIVESN